MNYKSSYTPEILEQVEYVCKDPAFLIFSQTTKKTLDYNQITNFLISICSFLKANHANLGTVDYILKLNLTNTEKKNIINAKRILTALSGNTKMIEINSELSTLSRTDFTDLSNSAIANYCLKNECTCIFVHNGTDITIYVKGIPAKEININYPLSTPRQNKKTSRSSKEYKLSMQDFYFNRVKPNITDHWYNKAKRILNGGDTEEIFQRQLANWLDENIGDGMVIQKVKKPSQDETDIEIRAFGGNIYLIEIKWLGINQGKTKYDEARIRDSIFQLRNYLNIEPTVVDASIAVYDGRTLDRFKQLKCVSNCKDEWKELSECLTEQLPPKGNCFVFFLISESASKRKN
jgi:hypothetical protein